MATNTNQVIAIKDHNQINLVEIGNIITREVLLADTIGTYTASNNETVILDKNAYKGMIVTMPTGAVTFSLTNMKIGSTYLVTLVYTGNVTINFTDTIKWINATGTAPVWSTIAGKHDSIVFLCTSAGNYDLHYQLDNGGI